MNSIPIIRLAKPTDTICLAALALQVWLHTYATDGIRRSIAEYVLAELTPGKFQAILDDERSVLLVAELDNHLIGYAHMIYDELPPPSDAPANATTEISTLYVQAHFLRKGIGSVLMNRCAELARTHDPDTRLWLTVAAMNNDAILFYRKLGFTEMGTSYFELPEERHLNYVMVGPEV